MEEEVVSMGRRSGSVNSSGPLHRARVVPTYSSWSQFKALYLKTLSLQKRAVGATMFQVLLPLIMLLLLLALQALVNSASTTSSEAQPHGYTYAPFHLLTRRPGQSTTNASFSWAASESAAAHMGQVRNLINMPTVGVKFVKTLDTGQGQPMGIISENLEDVNTTQLSYYSAVFSDRQQMEDNLFDQWNHNPTTVGAYYSDQLDFAANAFHVQVFQNFSLSRDRYDMPFIVSLFTSALSRTYTTSNYTMRLAATKTFPREKGQDHFDIISLAGPFFFFFILLQVLPVTLQIVVEEKENKLRSTMLMAGMRMRMYWLTQYIFSYVLYVAVILMLIIMGSLLGFRYFRDNSPAVYLLLFLIWGHVLVAISLLLSTFFSRKSTATLVAYFSIIGVAFLGNNLVNPILSDVENTPWGTVFGISMFPPFAVYRGLIYMSILVSFEGPGYQWNDLTTPGLNMAEVYGILAVQWIIIMLITFYLDAVLPSEYGVAKHPLWFLKRKPRPGTAGRLTERTPLRETQKLGKDIMEEERRVMAAEDTDDDAPMVRIMHLRKVYDSRGGAPPVVALRDMTMGVDRSQCLGILGHNGAGKSTMLSILSGLYTPTSGTAVVYGNDITTDIDQIHSNLGVCPQHDQLWDNLTAMEHLLLIGRLKNVPKEQLEGLIRSALTEVDLWNVRNELSKGFSGGMKRRLSVAVALFGDPPLIILDEPTTGLDAHSKRQVWSAIRNHKANASIMLTSHSVYEVDMLCNRVAIMAAGSLRCIGHSQELKNRFGAGLKLSVSVDQDAVEPFHTFITERFGSIVRLNELAGVCNYSLGKEGVVMADVFEAIQDARQHVDVHAWSVSGATLEEVFIRLTGADHLLLHQTMSHEDLEGYERGGV